MNTSKKKHINYKHSSLMYNQCLIMNSCYLEWRHFQFCFLIWFCRKIKFIFIIFIIHINRNYCNIYLLPGNTNTIVGHPEDPENFFSSIHELRFSWTEVCFGPNPRLCAILTGISKRRTSSDWAVPHWVSNSIVIHLTHSGKVT